MHRVSHEKELSHYNQVSEDCFIELRRKLEFNAITLKQLYPKPDKDNIF